MIGFGIRCRREPGRLRTRILCTAADHADLGKTKFSWNLPDWTFRETTGMRPAGGEPRHVVRATLSSLRKPPPRPQTRVGRQRAHNRIDFIGIRNAKRQTNRSVVQAQGWSDDRDFWFATTLYRRILDGFREQTVAPSGSTPPPKGFAQQLPAVADRPTLYQRQCSRRSGRLLPKQPTRDDQDVVPTYFRPAG